MINILIEHFTTGSGNQRRERLRIIGLRHGVVNIARAELAALRRLLRPGEFPEQECLNYGEKVSADSHAGR